MDFFLGGIMLFGGNYAPVNWELCNGRILPIDDYQALFTILGTTYGGDGKKTFALPKLAAPLPGMNYIICMAGNYPSHT